MYIALKIGEATMILDPTTGGPVTVIVTAIKNGRAEITVLAPPGMPVTKVRDPEPSIRRHCSLPSRASPARRTRTTLRHTKITRRFRRRLQRRAGDSCFHTSAK